MPRNLLVATRNPKKLRELHEILRDWDISLITLDDIEGIPEIEEDGNTFVENAIKKASTVAALSGFITLADDSGLVVDTLDGKPGVFSARFAGIDTDDEKNNLKLLAMMQGLSEEERTARFVCVIAIAEPGGSVQTVQGVCEGRIATSASGYGGFGYDPLFIPAGLSQSFAELTDNEKNEISHRGKALQEAKFLLQRILYMEGDI